MHCVYSRKCNFNNTSYTVQKYGNKQSRATPIATPTIEANLGYDLWPMGTIKCCLRLVVRKRVWLTWMEIGRFVHFSDLVPSYIVSNLYPADVVYETASTTKTTLLRSD